MFKKTYDVRVEFGRESLVVNESSIIIGVISAPENNKANIEIIKRLARHFKLPHQNVRIIRGLKSRKKLVEITIFG
ncbi:MAG: DUF167 domain-containing protein [Candidatus Aenigmarchaeota archaeon]|nr:DUF167 domain-containing protein [Candidatus Aenigmarchaeota archaeon]